MAVKSKAVFRRAPLPLHGCLKQHRRPDGDVIGNLLTVVGSPAFVGCVVTIEPCATSGSTSACVSDVGGDNEAAGVPARLGVAYSRRLSGPPTASEVAVSSSSFTETQLLKQQV